MWIHIGIWEICGILRVSIQTYVELCGPIYLKTSWCVSTFGIWFFNFNCTFYTKLQIIKLYTVSHHKFCYFYFKLRYSNLYFHYCVSFLRNSLLIQSLIAVTSVYHIWYISDIITKMRYHWLIKSNVRPGKKNF